LSYTILIPLLSEPNFCLIATHWEAQTALQASGEMYVVRLCDCAGPY
jgi:hypothetical protein